jgi:ParB family chromosome partitioning protein
LSSSHAELKNLPLNKIELSELNVRNLKDAQEDLDNLKESMRRRGLIHPIVVFPKGDKFNIVVGQRRYLAARELGWEEIPALIFEPMEATTGKILSALENLQRKELSFSDQCETAEFLYDHFGQDYKRVAKELGIKEQRVITLLKKRMVPKPVREMVDKKEISKGDALKAVIAAYPSENRIVEVAKSLKKLTKDEKDRFVQIATEQPESTPAEWVEAAKKPAKAVEYRIILLRKYATSLENAAKDRGEDVEETARIAIIDWLEAKGYA